MRFRDIFLAMILIAGAGIAGWIGVTGVSAYRLESESVNREDSKRVTTVLLSDRAWVEFGIPSDARSVRLMINAALSSTTPPVENQSDPRSGWRYSIEYQLLDRAGKILSQAPYHLRSSVRELIDAESGERIQPLVFGKTSKVSTQTRFVQIPLIDDVESFGERPASIRIRSGDRDPDVAEVVARVFTRHQRAHYDQRSTWKKISRKTRRNLARFCVFDHKFLTHSERASLLRWQWVKAVSIGEITHRHLYFIGDVDDQEVAETTPMMGVCLEPGWRSTVPAPQDAGELRFELERDAKEIDTPVYLQFSWYQNDQSPPRLFKVNMEGLAAEVKLPISGGIVEVECSSPVCYRCYWKNLTSHCKVENKAGRPLEFGEEIELTRALTRNGLRVYLADQEGVEYPITHLDDQPTPFRLSARIGFGDAFIAMETQSDKSDLPENAKVWMVAKELQWEYLDIHGHSIDQGVLLIEPEVSPYDRLWKQGRSHGLSEKKSFYFSIPAEVASVKFSSGEPFLVNGAVRPYNIPYVTRIPEDQQPFESQNKTTRKWFGLKPQSHHDLIAANRSFVISTQPRTGLIDADDDAEEEIDPNAFQWQRFEPAGNWIGRQLLVPTTEENEIRRSSIHAYYFELTPNQTYDVNDFDFRTDEEYRLTFISSNLPLAKDSWIKIWQNDRMIYQQQMASSRGRISLHPEALSTHSQLRVECDEQTRLFFSGAEVTDANRFLKRTACRLQGGELKFPYTKSSPDLETLTLSIFDEAQDGQTQDNQTASNRCQLEIRIDAGDLQLQQTGPVENLTLLHRIYDIGATPRTGAILYGVDHSLDLEHKCFLQLGSDLPPGKYNISIRRLDGSQQGYVLLHQLSPKLLKSSPSP